MVKIIRRLYEMDHVPISRMLYLLISLKTNERLSVTATAKIVDQKTTIVNYNTNSSVPLVKTYWVMSTDYIHKAIVVSCEQIRSQHQLQLWSNKRRPEDCSSDDDEEDLASAMKSLGINEIMTPINQSGCVYY
ncbi:hypothetical protein G9C98_005951 [Cotesia typhae]|uniref:Uncharacterized protein n=1 Tax=Cotesia typhae TaxID=2053667 RepID=A0A8J5UUR6_9HYME|nr:hypothetical protein G9C98_005951 [Cotesia typhae]